MCFLTFYHLLFWLFAGPIQRMWEVMVPLWKILCHSQWNWSKYPGSVHPQLYTGTSFQILNAYQSHKEFSSQLCIIYYFDSVVLMRMSSKGRLLQKWHCIRILDYRENDIMGRYHLQKDSGVSTVPFRMKRWIRYVYLDEPFHLFLWNSVVLFSVGFMSDFACVTACAILRGPGLCTVATAHGKIGYARLWKDCILLCTLSSRCIACILVIFSPSSIKLKASDVCLNEC
jgi:hypothetical protein